MLTHTWLVCVGLLVGWVYKECIFIDGIGHINSFKMAKMILNKTIQ